MKLESTRALYLLRASGRCTGASIFSLFGGGWLLAGLSFLRSFTFWRAAVIGTASLSLAAVAFWMVKTHPDPVLDEALAAQKHVDDRRFWVINAVTYTAVFLLFPVLSTLKLQDYILPSFVALVGFHFFPMPGLYQHMANLVTGACLIVWAVTCVVMFRPDGDRIAAWVALGAGVVLWTSSVSALITARRLFRESVLMGI